MSLCCDRDLRRAAVRSLAGWNGLDYAEIDPESSAVNLYFLGKLPPELSEKKPGLAKYLRVEGGERITGIQVLNVEPVTDPDPEKDEWLILTFNKTGDFSNYTIHLTGVEKIDPRHDHVKLNFKLDCPSDLDCAAPCACATEATDTPEINYLAKDYGSFRQLILDRLAVIMPDWQETHVPDLGIALVETLAYTADYLSYYQDAVGTEAYIGTARQRISVRRHARLMDYRLHEGCNARTWLCFDTAGVLELDNPGTAFITGLNDTLAARGTILTWPDLEAVPITDYEVFEPLVPAGTTKVRFIPAHNEIHFHSFGEKNCCIARGATKATLVDSGLDLKPGSVLIFEEVRGPGTGQIEDADPTHKAVVRLTKVMPGSDPVILTEGRPTPYLAVEWSKEDAVPFPMCISTIGPANDCLPLDNVTVARGNILLADNGHTQPPENPGTVGCATSLATCECAGEPGDVEEVPKKFYPALAQTHLTYSQPLPSDRLRLASAYNLSRQDVQKALPQTWLTSDPSRAWNPVCDLIESHSDSSDYVIEIDNDGIAHLRFGDGDLGFQPPCGMQFTAAYRTGNGKAGNVGRDSISRIVTSNKIDPGFAVSVRNPIAASGGADPEPIDEAKLFAPRAFRTVIERAITPADYEALAERNKAIQGASAQLVWTGSWYEADVAIDPVGTEKAPPSLLSALGISLNCYRRIGQDLSVRPARYVPIDVMLDVCALPEYLRAHVKAALLAAFSARKLPGGKLGFFHPDNLKFGEGLYLSQIIATAQSVPGVECVHVVRFNRLFLPPNNEIVNGVLHLHNSEIAQLDNDPDYPEHGKLEFIMRGGR
jgi:hypothetical protein